MRAPNELLILVSVMILVVTLCAPDRDSPEAARPAPGHAFARESFWLHEQPPEKIEYYRDVLGDEEFQSVVEQQAWVLEGWGDQAELERTRQIQRDHEARMLGLASRP